MDQPPKGKPNGTGKRIVVCVVVDVVEIITLYQVQTGRI